MSKFTNNDALEKWHENPDETQRLGESAFMGLVMWLWWGVGTIYLLPVALAFAVGKKLNIADSKRLLKILTMWKKDAFPLPEKRNVERK